jgi:thiol:disulfide interchange protein
MISWLKQFWWAGKNHGHLTELMQKSEAQMRANTLMLNHAMRTNRELLEEVQRLQSQSEHDSLMIQAYANWCEACKCTPTQEELQRASGKKA